MCDDCFFFDKLAAEKLSQKAAVLGARDGRIGRYSGCNCQLLSPLRLFLNVNLIILVLVLPHTSTMFIVFLTSCSGYPSTNIAAILEVRPLTTSIPRLI